MSAATPSLSALSSSPTLAIAQTHRIPLPETGAIERRYRVQRRWAWTYWCRERVLIRTPDDEGNIHQHEVPYAAVSAVGVQRTRFGSATLFAGAVTVFATFPVVRTYLSDTTKPFAFEIPVIGSLVVGAFVAVPEERVRIMTAEGTWDFATYRIGDGGVIDTIRNRIRAARPAVRSTDSAWNAIPLVFTTPASRVQEPLKEGAIFADLSEVAVGLPPGPAHGISYQVPGVLSVIPAILVGVLVIDFLKDRHLPGGDGDIAPFLLVGFAAWGLSLFSLMSLWRMGRVQLRRLRRRLGF